MDSEETRLMLYPFKTVDKKEWKLKRLLMISSQLNYIKKVWNVFKIRTKYQRTQQRQFQSAIAAGLVVCFVLNFLLPRNRNQNKTMHHGI